MRKPLVVIFLVTMVPAILAVAFPWWWPILLSKFPEIRLYLESHREIQTLAGLIQVALFIATPCTFIIGYWIGKRRESSTIPHGSIEEDENNAAAIENTKQGDVVTGGINIKNLDNLIISASQLTDEYQSIDKSTDTINLLGYTLGILSKFETNERPVDFERLKKLLNTEIAGTIRDAAVKKALDDLTALGLVKTETLNGDSGQIGCIQLLDNGKKVLAHLLEDNENTYNFLQEAKSKTNDETDFALSLVALKTAEETYLANLKNNLSKLYTGRRVIDLQSEIVNPIDEEAIDTEIYLRRNRHRITLVMYEAGSSEQRSLNVHEAAAEYDLLMILGDPGAGKTWTLGDIALKHIDDYQANLKSTLPLFVRAADWVSGIKPIEFLRNGLCEQLALGQQTVSPNTRILLDRFENDLATGRYVVMIDALNEMPHRRISRGVSYQSDQKRFNLTRAQVESQAKAARDGVRGAIGDEREWRLSELVEHMPDTRFIVTCRTLDYEPRTLPWPQARISPLNESQIVEFVQSRLMRVNNAAQDMLAELKRNSAAQSLSLNPFYLEIMTSVFERNLIAKMPQLLPRRRGELLGQLVSLRFRDSLHDNINEHEVHEAYNLNETVLSSLALEMLSAGYAGASAPSSIAEALEESAIKRAVQSGLISLSSEAGVGETIAFYHELIQEYYAALGLANGQMRVSLKKLLRNQRWAEVIALWIELEKNQRKKERLFKSVLKGLNQHGIFHHKPALPLAVAILQLFLTLLFPILLGVLVVEMITEEGILLRFFRSYPAIMVAIGLVLPFFLIRFWRALYFDFNIRKSSAHILSSLPYPEMAGRTVDKMVGLLKKNNYLKNAPLIDALVKLGDFSRKRLQSILHKGSSKARFAAAIALARIGDTKEAKAMSMALAGDDYVPIKDDTEGFYAILKMRWAQVKNLRRGIRDFLRTILVSAYMQHVSHALIPHLFELWRRTTNPVQRFAIFTKLIGIQGNLPKECAVDLSEILSSLPADQGQHIAAIILMGKIGDADSIRNVFELLDRDIVPDQSKPQVIAQLINVRDEAVPVLVDYLDHNKIEIRCLAISLLGHVGRSARIRPEQLLPLLEDEALEVQLAAIDTAGKLKLSDARDNLVRIIADTHPDKDENALFRFYQAMRALGDIGDPNAAKPISEKLSQLYKYELSHDLYVNLAVGMLQCLERLKSNEVLPDIRLLLKKEQDPQVLLGVIKVLSSIGDTEALDIIDSLPYQQDPVIRLQIIGMLKKLGKSTRRRSAKLIEAYLGDENPEVKSAAQRALIQISPVTQNSPILQSSMHSHTWISRLTKKFLNVLGLGPLDSFGHLWWSVVKQAGSTQIAVQIKNSSLLGAQNEFADEINQYIQQVTQFSQFLADLAANRPTSLQQQISKFIIFWIPIFLTTVGIFYLFNLQYIIVSRFSFPPLSWYWFITLLGIMITALPETRGAARTWLLSLMAGLSFGLPIYSRVLEVINFWTYWWVWIVVIVLYITILLIVVYKKSRIDEQRYKKQSDQLDAIIGWLLFLPGLPILCPYFFIEALIVRATERYGQLWWMSATAMMAACWLAVKIVVSLKFINALPVWWIWIPFGVSTIFLIADEIDFRLGSTVQVLTGIAVLPALPIYFVYFQEIKNYTMTKTNKLLPAGRFALALWLAIIPGEILYGKLYDLSLAILPVKFIAISLIALSVLYFLGHAISRIHKIVGKILSLPFSLILLPLRLIGLMVKVVIDIFPFIVIPFIFLLRIVPLKMTRLLADLMDDMPVGFTLSTLLGIAIGSFFGFDLARRIILLIPAGILPYILPLLMLWISVMILAIYTYRQKNYVTFVIILFTLLMPILPSLLVLFVITSSAIILSLVLDSPDDEVIQNGDSQEETV
jgi:HEAT repeat protein